MAGLGFKDFQVGEVLTSADVDGYLMQQTVMRFADAGARGSALGTAPGTAVALAEGMVSYLDDVNDVQVYSGSAWASLIGVKQTVQTVKTDTFSASVAQGGISGAAISASVTPGSSDSRVLVIASLTISAQAQDLMSFATLYRDGSPVFQGDAASTRQRVSTIAWQMDNTASSVSIVFLDSPATTSSVTYDVRLSHGASATRSVYLNRSFTDSDSNVYGRGVSSLTLLEVPA